MVMQELPLFCSFKPRELRAVPNSRDIGLHVARRARFCFPTNGGLV